MFAMRLDGIAALSALSMAASYSAMNWASDVWYMQLTVENSAMRK